MKRWLLNECWSHWLGVDIHPRFGLPRALSSLLRPLYSRVPPPFELEVLTTLPRGKLLDIGCGDGTVLKLSARISMDVTGLEVDPAAIRTARSEGLAILDGTYRLLSDYPNSFDYIICSYVIEHVHEPHALLKLITATLKEGEKAMISCPNSQSYVRKHFGSCWRGLEAPRHLGIPSLDYLAATMQGLGFTVTRVHPLGRQQSDNRNEYSRSVLSRWQLMPFFPMRTVKKRQ